MQAQEVRCPSCFAPVPPTHTISTCRYCGTTLAIHGAPAAPKRSSAGAAVFLEDAGSNKIEVIKVIRAHTGIGLREAKELIERAPCVVADWPSEPTRAVLLFQALARAGARVR